MADLYRITYQTVDNQQKMLLVSATSVANALAAVKTADSKHKVDTTQPSIVVVHPNITIGS